MHEMHAGGAGNRRSPQPSASSDPYSLTTNRQTNPIGIDSLKPEFGWRTDGARAMEAYDIEVRPEGSTEAVWRTGWTASEHPYGVLYQGYPLHSRSGYEWRVRVRFTDHAETGWSRPGTFETGIFQGEKWEAGWISDGPPPPKPTASKERRPVLYFRKDIELGADVVRARAYASALGWYRLFINGQDLTGPALVPRWTPLDSYVEYQTYDVTPALSKGTNALAVVVADGRYRGASGAMSKDAIFGERLAAFMQIEIELTDGSRLMISTDDTWHVGYGRITTADPKRGERVDLRVDGRSWQLPGHRAERSSPVSVLPQHPRKLIAEQLARLTAIDSLAPLSISRTPNGATLIDFGQNISGVARLRLAGITGDQVSISYSEVLTPEGELDVNYLDIVRRSKEWFQKDEVILGSSPEEYVPWFTIRGFRYVAVEGIDHDLTTDDIEAVIMSTDLQQTAWFESSNDELNQIWENTLRGLRGNFLDTPTDCPTRERAGWTGDIQVFAPTASTLVDADSYLRRYLFNLAAEQRPDGTIPDTIPHEESSYRTPDLHSRPASTAAGWGDAAVILPWTLHRYYGDVLVLRHQYPSAKTWVEQLRQRAARRSRKVSSIRRRIGDDSQYIVDTGFHYGEWLRPGETMGGQIVLSRITGQPIVATAYLAQSASLLAEIAQTIGMDNDAGEYRQFAADVRKAWQRAFVRDEGRRIGADKQDDYVRAIAFKLIPERQYSAALDRLAELIHEKAGHLGTGFLSTPLLLPTLADHGRSELACALLLQPTAPSWIGQIRRGATTWWESWEGYDRKGRAKYSHNHYAFGSVSSFLIHYVAGIRPTGPGWKQILVEPIIGGGLTHATATVQTPYGMVTSAWKILDRRFQLELTIPAGITATVKMPMRGDEEPIVVEGGAHTWTQPADAATSTMQR